MPASSLRRQLSVAAALAALLAAAAASPAAGAIRLKAAEGPVLASFPSVSCKVNARKGFTASGRAGGWRLTVRVYSFSGYKRYPIEYGSEGNADFFATRGDATYTNVAKPEPGIPGGPELTLGGAVAFPGGKGTLGVAFPLAYRALDFESQASLVGRAACRS